MNILELFAGSRSFGRVAESKGHNVFSVDWEPYDGIHLVADIGLLQESDIPFVPDVVWASPDCSTHREDSIIPKTPYAKQCDITNQHFLQLLKSWGKKNPSLLYFIENPRGMLRKMPFMPKDRRETVWYCQYGDERAKPTDIWTNSQDWQPKPQCFNGNPACDHAKAPRGSRTGTQGRKDSYERSRIPYLLCKEIIDSFQ